MSESLLFNPFQPNSLARPDMFVGRHEELDKVEKCLFQTFHGNPQHFLIEGERGIGKSSMLLYIHLLATGVVMPVLNDRKYSFVSVFTDLGKCNSEIQIVQELARGIKRELINRGDLKQQAQRFWDWVIKWEVMGTKFNGHDVNQVDSDIALEQFVHRVSELLNDLEDIDGLLFLLDEADAPDSSANLGAMLKLSAERLQRAGCDNVIFGIAGLPTLLPKLRLSHESSLRLFEILVLNTLELPERREVLTRGIDRANAKNTLSVNFHVDALEEICRLSEGYPHFLQQFAYCAFEANSDQSISLDDVLDGAHDENGAIDQLGAKFFHDMYHARISSDNYRSVLNTMAERGDQWAKRNWIQSESGLPEYTVTNALRSLKQKNIIIHDESRQGFYRLPNRSFAVWINATKRSSGAQRPRNPSA